MNENYDSPIESSGELITVSHTSLPQLFSEGKIAPLIGEIETKAKSFSADISTQKGRKDLASFSHKIARAKTLLDNAGKSLTQEWKEKCKKIDTQRSNIWKKMEEIQKDVRKPLTDWENAEKERVAKHQTQLSWFNTNLRNCDFESAEDIKNTIDKNSEHYSSNEWEEYKPQASELYLSVESCLNKKLVEFHEKKELERLRMEEQERIRKEQEKLELEKAKEVLEIKVCDSFVDTSGLIITLEEQKENSTIARGKYVDLLSESMQLSSELKESIKSRQKETESTSELHKQKIHDEIDNFIMGLKTCDSDLFVRLIINNLIPHVKVVY